MPTGSHGERTVERVSFPLSYPSLSGCASSGNLEEGVFSQLVKSGDVHATGQQKSATLGGIRSGAIGRLSRLRIGGFETRDLRMSTCKGAHVLGLDYWRRYRVTFDFIGERLFLAKSKYFADRDVGHMCGMHLLFKKDKVVVAIVDDKSPAGAAGIKVNDVLVTLCGRPVSKMKPAEIYDLFGAEGKRITMTLDRNGKRVEVAFTLKEYD